MIEINISIISLIISSISLLYSLILIFSRFLTYENDNYKECLIYVINGIILVSYSYYISNNKYIFLNYEYTYNVCHGITMLSTFTSLKLAYLHIVAGKKYRPMDLNGKVYIITGSNAGIGFETAKDLALMGATVILACRSILKAYKAKHNILKETNIDPSNVIVLHLDLCSFDSIYSFVNTFDKLQLPLHCLINNAGLMMERRSVESNGYETVLMANVLAPFLLSNLMLPYLEKTNGRIVNIASSLHKMCPKINFDDMMFEKNYHLFTTYAHSKLALVINSIELQRRLISSRSKVTCNIVHPGLVRTEITKNMNIFMRYGNMLAQPLLATLHKTPSQGAYTSIYCAIDPDLEGIGGKYFFHCQAYPLSSYCMNDSIAYQLWDIMEKLIKNKYNIEKGKSIKFN